jgi:hypothetical protein
LIARGGSGVVIASQSGNRLPVEELLGLPFLRPDQVTDSLHACQISKRGNSLRVMAEAVRWGKRGARIDTISWLRNERHRACPTCHRTVSRSGCAMTWLRCAPPMTVGVFTNVPSGD